MLKLRNTKQKEVLEEEYKTQKGLFTSEDLFTEAQKKDKSIGIATVYRFLKDKKNKNQIFSYTCDRKIVYSNKESSHCHYVCERTGKVIHFTLNNLDFLKEIKSKIPGPINSFQIEIKGTCENCKNK